MVIDRLFLILFSIVNVVGTIVIILQVRVAVHIAGTKTQQECAIYRHLRCTTRGRT